MPAGLSTVPEGLVKVRTRPRFAMRNAWVLAGAIGLDEGLVQGGAALLCCAFGTLAGGTLSLLGSQAVIHD